MLYIYLTYIVVATYLLMIRSMIYLQMGGYINALVGGIRREYIYNIMLSISLDIFYLILYYLELIKVYYIISFILISFSLIYRLSIKYKVKPNITKRLKRIIYAYLAIYWLILLILLLIITYFRVKPYYIIIINCILILSTPVLFLVNICLSPLEKRKNEKYIRSCAKVLKNYTDTKIIGITGSFGKTSIKNILTTILSQKFKVKCTPHSYNTPIGIAKSIELLDGDEDYFVVEMGARHEGDIDELCHIAPPNYAIISGVTSQHMETFKDIKVVEHTKYELYKNIKNDGFCIFNGKNDVSYKMYNYSRSANSILSTSKDTYIDEVNYFEDGMTFRLHLFGESRHCYTSLIGSHNIDNILMSSIMAYKLGMDIRDIGIGISKIKQIPHRLELINSGGITIIDDSYNANIEGVKSALDTINHLDKRKIVAMQGIVEGGKMQDELNIEIGRYMASRADIAILIGRESHHVAKGLREEGFDENKIIFSKSLNDAMNIFSKLLRCGDVLLLTNDLPDNY